MVLSTFHSSVNWLLRPFLQLPVYRLALTDSRFYRLVIYIHSMGHQRSLCPTVFDPEKAERSLQRFLSLGAREHFIVPEDGKGTIHMMTFRACDLEDRVIALGGTWKKMEVDSQTVFAIAVPENPSDQWKEFEEKILRFGWEKRGKLIITCKDADLINPENPPKCFFYVQSTSHSFTSNMKLAGLVMGMRQDLCFFNHGNLWKSTGRPSPSEETFYLDAKAVFDKIKDNYAPWNIYVWGSCGGGPVAAYIKRISHGKGVHFIGEQTFADLEDFIRPISTFWMPRVLSCLHSKELSLQISRQLPSCNFSIRRLWEELEKTDGKVIITAVEDDEYLSKEATRRLLDVAKKVSSRVIFIPFDSSKKYHHTDHCFHYPDSRRMFTWAVFS